MSKTNETDLRESWLVIKRRRGTVLFCLLVSVGLAFSINNLAQPVYRATSKVLVLQEPFRSPVTGQVMEDRNPYSERLALDTSAALITNRTLLTRLVTILRERWSIDRLDQPPGFFQLLKHQMGFALAKFPEPLPLFARSIPAQDVSEDERLRAELQEQTDLLHHMINVEPVRDTRLVNIHVEHQTPTVAKTIADALAHLFIEYQLEQKTEATTNLTGYLESQLAHVKRKIEESERAFYAFKEREGLFSLEGKLREKTESIAGLNAAYVKTNAERFAVRARLGNLKAMRKANPHDWARLPIQSQTLDVLRQKLILAQEELTKAKVVYKSQHPRLKTLKSTVEFIKNNIQEELVNQIANLAAEDAILQSREQQLRSAIAESERELHRINNNALQYSVLERELSTNRDLYNLLLTKLKETDISGKVRIPMIQLVDPAHLPTEPVRPMKALNFTVSLALGLLGGMALIFSQEYFRRTIGTPRDVAAHLQLPVLGMIPKGPRRWRWSTTNR